MPTSIASTKSSARPHLNYAFCEAICNDFELPAPFLFARHANWLSDPRVYGGHSRARSFARNSHLHQEDGSQSRKCLVRRQFSAGRATVECQTRRRDEFPARYRKGWVFDVSQVTTS